MIVGIIAFILRSLISLPFAYIYTCGMQFKKIINLSKKSCKNLTLEFSILLFLVLFGVPYLLVLSVIDCGLYVASLFANNSKNLKNKHEELEENGFNKIHPELFKILIKVLGSQASEEINVKHLVLFFRKKLQITTQIRRILFFTEAVNESKSRMIEKIDEQIPRFNFDNNSQREASREATAREARINEANNIPTLPAEENLNENTVLINDFICDKTPRYILEQYNAIKRFLNCNAIVRPETNPVNRTLSHSEHNISGASVKSSITRLLHRQTPKYINKSKLLQLLSEESEKDKFLAAIHSIKRHQVDRSSKPEEVRVTKKIKPTESNKELVKALKDISSSHPFCNLSTKPDYSRLRMLKLGRNWNSINEEIPQNYTQNHNI